MLRDVICPQPMTDIAMAGPVTPPILIRDEDELLDAIRARLVELNITYDTLDAVALLPERYTSKLLCRPPIKHAGALTLWNILGTLGFKISLVATDVPTYMRERLTPREHPPQPTGKRRIDFSLTRAFMRKIGRKGGKARAAIASKKRRLSRINRLNALKRWHKPQTSEG
jgi:hypothetical protein